MALSDRFGHLKGPASTVAGSEHTLYIGGHPAVYPDVALLRLQGGEQIGGGHRLAQDKNAGAGNRGSVRLQGGDGLLPLDRQPTGPDKGNLLIQSLGLSGGDIGDLAP